MKKRIITIVFFCATIVLLFGVSIFTEKALNSWHNLNLRIEDIEKSLAHVEELYAINTEANMVSRQQHYNLDYQWAENNKYIAHAMGEIEGYRFTNSLEAFKKNYDRGLRVFEVDFQITEDYILVATHDPDVWRESAGVDSNTPFTVKNFESHRIFADYTPLKIEDVIQLMVTYPDIYIVTDTKEIDETNVLLQFYQIVSVANKIDSSVLDRIIPQIYHEKMLDWIMSVYPFKSVIFTLYQAIWTPDEIVAFCHYSGIGYITIDYKEYSEDYLNKFSVLGIKCALHTINDQEMAKKYFDSGIAGLYTDSLC